MMRKILICVGFLAAVALVPARGAAQDATATAAMAATQTANAQATATANARGTATAAAQATATAVVQATQTANMHATQTAVFAAPVATPARPMSPARIEKLKAGCQRCQADQGDLAEVLRHITRTSLVRATNAVALVSVKDCTTITGVLAFTSATGAPASKMSLGYGSDYLTARRPDGGLTITPVGDHSSETWFISCR